MPTKLFAAAEPTAPPAAVAAPAAAETPLLDAEKLDVYRVAVEYRVLVNRFLTRRMTSALRDQLDRASASIVLNVAEGAGRFSPADKARFYAIARGSDTECAAILDVLLAGGLLEPAAARRGRSLLVRIVQMLTKLNLRLGR